MTLITLWLNFTRHSGKEVRTATAPQWDTINEALADQRHLSAVEEPLEADFAREAAQHDLDGLAGHRSFGGIRASIYNAIPTAGCEALVAFMDEFRRTRG